jgi:hypothetical protein
MNCKTERIPVLNSYLFEDKNDPNNAGGVTDSQQIAVFGLMQAEFE